MILHRALKTGSERKFVHPPKTKEDFVMRHMKPQAQVISILQKRNNRKNRQQRQAESRTKIDRTIGGSFSLQLAQGQQAPRTRSRW